MVSRRLPKRKVQLPKHHHKCADCEYAYLMRSLAVNPVISLCRQGRDREVANVVVKCELFRQRQGEAVIHQMVYATDSDTEAKILRGV